MNHQMYCRERRKGETKSSYTCTGSRKTKAHGVSGKALRAICIFVVVILYIKGITRRKIGDKYIRHRIHYIFYTQIVTGDTAPEI